MAGSRSVRVSEESIQIPTEDQIDEVLVRLFFADNNAWLVMLGLRADRDKWKHGLQGIE